MAAPGASNQTDIMAAPEAPRPTIGPKKFLPPQSGRTVMILNAELGIIKKDYLAHSLSSRFMMGDKTERCMVLPGVNPAEYGTPEVRRDVLTTLKADNERGADRRKLCFVTAMFSEVSPAGIATDENGIARPHSPMTENASIPTTPLPTRYHEALFEFLNSPDLDASRFIWVNIEPTADFMAAAPEDGIGIWEHPGMDLVFELEEDIWEHGLARPWTWTPEWRSRFFPGLETKEVQYASIRYDGTKIDRRLIVDNLMALALKDTVSNHVETYQPVDNGDMWKLVPRTVGKACVEQARIDRAAAERRRRLKQEEFLKSTSRCASEHGPKPRARKLCRRMARKKQL